MAIKRLYRTMMAGAGACALSLAALPAQAGQWWIFGDKIYNTGAVTASDDATLGAMLAKARVEGIAITSVVLRNNPGGDAAAGQRISNLIRANNLNTVFQGGCYSACATAFVGGVGRRMAMYDLPAIYTAYAENVIGFHGGSVNGVPARPSVQQTLLNHQLGQLGVTVDSPLGQRLRQAHFELGDSQGFLRYRDPAVTGEAATIFCPTAAAWTAAGRPGCTTYAGVNLYSDGVLTSPGAVTLEDMRAVTTPANGDLNPGFTTGVLWRNPYGLVKIADGGVWTLGTASRAFLTWIAPGGEVVLRPGGRLGPGGEVVIDKGGVVTLQGGTLSSGRTWNDQFGIPVGDASTIQHQVVDTPLTYAKSGSLITGTGGIADATVIAGTVAPKGGPITFKPVAYQNDYVTGTFDYIRMTGTSLTLLQVSPGTSRAQIRNETSEVHSVGSGVTGSSLSDLRFYSYSTRLIMLTPVQIQAGATLGVTIARGFYRPGQSIPLFEGVVNPARLETPDQIRTNSPAGVCNLCSGYGPNDTPLNFAALLKTPYFSGHFTNFLRTNDGTVVGLDPFALTQRVDAAQDSLLGFDLVYTAQSDTTAFGIYYPAFQNNFSKLELVARPAFEDVALFANKASGDGLGLALQAASSKSDPGNAGVLGALQFSTSKAAAAAAGDLRGDAYATQMLLNQALSASLDDMQLGRLGRRGTGGAATSAVTSAFSNPAINALLEGQGMGRVLADLMERPPSAEAAANPGSGPGWKGWGDILIGRARIAQGSGVHHLTADYQGVVLGVDAAADEGDAVAGASLTYLSVESETRGGGYASDDDLLSAALYANYPYGRIGDLSLVARATRTSRDTRRMITGVAGLETPVVGDDVAVDVSARLANTIALGSEASAVRVIAPIISWQRTSAPALTETGGEFALRVDGRDLESLRIGAGVAFTRSFKTPRSTVTPSVRLTYERETEDVAAAVVARFSGEPDLAFAVNSRDLGRDIASVDLGLTLAGSDAASIGVHYAGRFRTGLEQHAGFVALRLRF